MGGREAQEGEDVCTHTADSHCLQQELTQHRKTIILQLTIYPMIYHNETIFKKSAYTRIYMYNQITLLYKRNCIIVNQLSFNKNKPIIRKNSYVLGSW